MGKELLTKEFLYCSPDRIYNLSRCLAETVKGSGYEAEYLIGPLRGACWPIRILADLLELPIAMIEVKYYEHGKVATARKAPKITQPCPIDVEGKKILIVEDVVDSGETLKVAKQHIEQRGAEEVRTSSLHYKPCSTFRPDFYVEETDAWIIYQWELGEFIKGLIENGEYTEEEKDLILDRSGIPKVEISKTMKFYKELIL